MESLFLNISGEMIALSFAIGLLAGIVKGLVGFAMPMVLISGLSTFLAPEVALAGLIAPTLVTNAMQVFRAGVSKAGAAVWQFRVFLVCVVVALMISAQFVLLVPAETLLLIIGVPVTLLSVVQLLGFKPVLKRAYVWVEAAVGTFAGLLGGFAGVWGPPTVLYLTALNTPKRDAMRVQGVIYGLGSVALVVAHIGSGVLTMDTLPFSLAMVVPAVLGMWSRGQLQDRIDQQGFRKATLLVLTIAGINLVRRGLMG